MFHIDQIEAIEELACARVKDAGILFRHSFRHNCSRPHHTLTYEIDVVNSGQHGHASNCVAGHSFRPSSINVSYKSFYACLDEHDKVVSIDKKVSIYDTHTDWRIPEDIRQAILYSVNNDDSHILNIIHHQSRKPHDIQYVFADTVMFEYAEVLERACPSILNYSNPATFVHDDDIWFATQNHKILVSFAYNCHEYCAQANMYARPIINIPYMCKNRVTCINYDNNTRIRRGRFKDTPYLGIHDETYTSYARRMNISDNGIHVAHTVQEENIRVCLWSMLVIVLSFILLQNGFVKFIRKGRAAYRALRYGEQHDDSET